MASYEVEKVLRFLVKALFVLWHIALGVVTALIQYLIYRSFINIGELWALFISCLFSIISQGVYVTYQIYQDDPPQAKVKDILEFYIAYTVAVSYIPFHY